MANIDVKKESGPQLVRRGEWDPMRWARDLLRWDPFREMTSMPTFEQMGFSPDFEVKETQEGFQFKADLPGVQEKDVEITRTGNRLTIAGKRESEKEEKGDTWYVSERSYGSFTRAFTLPEGIDGDHVRAELKDGVLTVLVPKLPEVQPKKVEISGGQKKS
jgi:HSP20 family protein